ncbi:i-spanin [Caulobacter phage BL198]|uniref:I-spanin n=1 Tax=Caulobacter phage BL198 TaxID=3020395 RepID=A0AAF0B808_9CAUD|nr:i-spanin [Caulobacter phage BL198]
MTNKVSSAWKSASLLIAVVAVFLLVWASFAQHAATQRQVALQASQAEARGLRETLNQWTREVEKADKVTVQAAQAKQKIAQSTAKQQEKVDNAVQKHPEWAAEPIPADVLDSLRD